MMHYRHYFDAAGHGTFFFGRLRVEGASIDAFTWVYDCGSLRKSRLKGLVQKFASRSNGRKAIDLVCLSHFDSDHVSGLDLIVGNFQIGTLVLPYVPLDVRLRLASEVSEEIAGAGDLAAYIFDPVFYLEQRDFGARINRIAIIRGGRLDDDDAEQTETSRRVPGDDRSPLSDGFALNGPSGHPLDAEDGYAAGNRGLSDRTNVYGDDLPWLVEDLYEFVFYSKVWPEVRAPKSGLSIAEVAQLARNIITQYHLIGAGTPDSGWLEALRDLYDTHFGSGYKQRNEISLCVFAGVSDGRALDACSLFTRQESAIINLTAKEDAGRGVLLTGDAYLNPTELKNLLSHLGDRREKLSLMQIPHHGSNNNWSSGNAAQCNAEYYVICAPGTSRHHPGTVVMRDLPGYVLADYNTSVSFDYHDSRR